MKKSLIVVAAMIVAASTYGQGTIVFNNLQNTVFRAAIYGPEPSDPLLEIHGNTSNSTYSQPTGTAVYNGSRLDGSSYSMQLFAGPSGVTDSTTLVSATVGGVPYIASFKTGAAAGFMNPSSTVVDIPGVAGGSVATLQVRAWNNGGGAYSTYAAAAAAPGGYVGSSLLYQSAVLGDSTASPPIVSPFNAGMTSFNIHQVPEPSTIALGVIGAAGFLIRRRKA